MAIHDRALALPVVRVHYERTIRLSVLNSHVHLEIIMRSVFGVLVGAVCVLVVWSELVQAQVRSNIDFVTLIAGADINDGSVNVDSEAEPFAAAAGAIFDADPPHYSTSMNTGAGALTTNLVGTLDIPQVSASAIVQGSAIHDGTTGVHTTGGSFGMGTVISSDPSGITSPVQTVFLYLAAGGNRIASGPFPVLADPGASGGVADAGGHFLAVGAVDDSPLWDVGFHTPNIDYDATVAGVNQLDTFQVQGCNVTFSASASASYDLMAPGPGWGSVKTVGQAGVVAAAWGYCTESGAPTAQLRFDFDGDGSVNASDIDRLASGSRELDMATDVDGDGAVNLYDGAPVHPMLDLNMDQDVSFRPSLGSSDPFDSDDLLAAIGTTYGDANLDGNVNGADFVIWNTFKFQTGTGWSQGDFNGDGITNGQDFVIWNSNNGYSADLIVPVPESASNLYLTCLVAILILRKTSPWYCCCT